MEHPYIFPIIWVHIILLYKSTVDHISGGTNIGIVKKILIKPFLQYCKKIICMSKNKQKKTELVVKERVKAALVRTV